MLYRRLLLCLFLVSALAQAQRSTGVPDRSNVGNVTIRVLHSDDRSAGSQLTVQLMSGAGSLPVATAFTDDSGIARFNDVRVGMYHAVVTGNDIEPADSGSFEVDARKNAQTQFVSVRRLQSQNQYQPGSRSATVAAADLNVPDDARKEFDKGLDAIQHQDWKKAEERLKKAIAIYPDYASAYNNLSVVYGQLKDTAQEREALEKAVVLNDHFGVALVSLAKICYHAHEFSRAETLLNKAAAAEPANTQTLLLLAQAQLVNQHYDATIATVRRIHSLPHEHLALAHYIAAEAYERQNQRADAVAQLKVFLNEEPDSPRSSQVRDQLGKLQSAQP